MDLETVTAEDFGRSLAGLGVNRLGRGVRGLAVFLGDVFGLSVHRMIDDFAVLRHGVVTMELHANATIRAHPLPGLLLDAGAWGAGAQFHLFGIDPDQAAALALARGDAVPEPSSDKPHGLRESTILSPEGHAFNPAVPRA
ncbi:MAG: glyoxalase [Roseicyclus sp.]